MLAFQRRVPVRIGTLLFCTAALLIFWRCFVWSDGYNRWLVPFRERFQDTSSSNSTLGVQRIFVISSEDPLDPASWRQKGLIAAANRTGIELELVSTRDLEEQEINEVLTASRGVAQAWAAHNRILRRIVNERIETALIMEDDADWDVHIRKLLAPRSLITKSVRQLMGSDSALSPIAWPYGKGFDIFWMGHCGFRAPEARANITFLEDLVLPANELAVWDTEPYVASPNGTRSVRLGGGVLCTFAYAITLTGAQKLLERLKRGGDAFDVEMNNACKDTMSCVTVQPELIHQQRMVGGKDSLIAEVDGTGTRGTDHGRPITFNIRYSARCNARHEDTDLVQCLPQLEDRFAYNGR